ncbi:MAG: exo-alpha-sialidase [Ruminococcus sp.]|nr:exo-alpha-sialidase [Ruminococcus sp.]
MHRLKNTLTAAFALAALSGGALLLNGRLAETPSASAAQTELGGRLISSVEILDTDYLGSWDIDLSLEVGDKFFSDRTVEAAAVSELPDGLNGAELILTPCDSKNSSKDQAIITAAQRITLYAALDSRVEAVPSWLSGWAKENNVIKTTNDVTFVLYSKVLRMGESVTLGANGQASGCMNYAVIASDNGIPRCDVNMDGYFNVADLVLVQKWLLAAPDAELADWKAADLCSDGRLDAFDLSMLRQEFVRMESDRTSTTTTAVTTTTTTSTSTTTTIPYSQRKFSFSVNTSLFDQSNTDTLSLSYPEGAETVTVWKADDTSDHYCNGVCLAAFRGRLYCQWQSSAVDEDSDDTHVMYSFSSDGGRTWSEPEVLAQNIGNGYCTSGGWLATDDRLVAYINFWDNDLTVRGGWTYYMTTKDGSTWTQPRQVTMADGSPLSGVFEQDPHVLSTGRIVNAAHFQDGLFVCPIYTDDPSGVTGWRKGSFTASGTGTSSTEMEPSLFVQSDGTLAMIFRDQNSSYRKLISYSLDDGATWSKVQSTDMPDARTKQSAGNLSDGTAFMAGCPVTNSLRSPLAVTLSKDGKTFDYAYLLRSNSSDPELVYEGKAKRKGFHYCKSLVYDGYLYVGYATNKEAVEITIVPEDSLTK